MSDSSFPTKPLAPEGARAMEEYPTLASIRDALTQASGDKVIAETIQAIVRNCQTEPGQASPYIRMRNLLEVIRRIPVGDDRIFAMSNVVRTLGQPDTLACFLDGLRNSVRQSGTEEREATRRKLLGVKMHSIYGWCGNTLIVETSDTPTAATFRCAPGLAERLGNSAVAWNLTIHIWQPNSSARGFPAIATLPAHTIVEPPHSHPFDFVSAVVMGEFHQSVYEPADGPPTDLVEGHYADVSLEHVDGVWPPHEFRKMQYLATSEHRVRLKQGDIYYMPCDAIHDVEVDGELARSRPTVTLFLSSEYMVMPHVYMTRAMADFHDEYPHIKDGAQPISEEAWHLKLEAIAAYLRGDSATLRLNDIVAHEGEYAFFHTRV